MRFTSSPQEPAPLHALLCLYCEWRVLTTPNIGHYELGRLEDHLNRCHDEVLAGKVGFYAPSPGLILEHFRVESGEADPA
jgi:hypothetical protein